MKLIVMGKWQFCFVINSTGYHLTITNKIFGISAVHAVKCSWELLSAKIYELLWLLAAKRLNVRRTCYSCTAHHYRLHEKAYK